MVSKSGFLNLLQIEVLLLAAGQELQVFSSLPLLSGTGEKLPGNCINPWFVAERFAQRCLLIRNVESCLYTQAI